MHCNSYSKRFSLFYQVKDPVEAWADMEGLVRSGVAKARSVEEEAIEVNFET